MRPILLFVFIIMLLSAGCTNQYKIPGDILPKNKMEKVLWDMILADRYSTLILAKDSTKDIKHESFILYEQVFSVHKITRDEFIKSFKYYLDRPDISQVMLDSLATKANRRREEMYRTPTPP
jgi:hypothetical protein